MSLSVGIVGLPNVGKSTLFNALLRKQQAYAANFPFATIEPNVGVVPVPDARLARLAEVIGNNPPEVPATIEFVDIAGLIAGAHKGEGLGNKFLAHIREVDAVCHVVRDFDDDNIVKEGVVDPESDLETIKTELAMADLQTLESVSSKKKFLQENPDTAEFVRKAVGLLSQAGALNSGLGLNSVDFSDDEKLEGKKLGLLTMKPILIVLNTDEERLKKASEVEKEFAERVGVGESQVVAINARLEEQLAGLGTEEAREYLDDVGISNSGLERLIKKAFETLGLITFLTAGEKEVRSWTIERGTRAPEAAGVIHTDFEKNFIKADVVSLDDFINEIGWKNCREKGKVRQEGRDYVVKDGDVIEFKVGS